MSDPSAQLPQRRLRRLWRRGVALFTIWSYSLLAPFGYVLFAVLSFVWRRDRVVRMRRLQSFTAGAYTFFHDWMRGVGLIEFDPRQRLDGVPRGPCVVIANHPTLADVTAITALLGGGCTIVKPELFQRPLLRGLLGSAGHIRGQRGGADQLGIGHVVEQAVERLGCGLRLIVFPEGTRSPPGGLHPFGRAPFEIAVRAGVPLVALTVESEPPYLTKEVSMYEPPLEASVLRIEVLAIHWPAPGGSSRALQRAVVAQYHAWLAGHGGALGPAAAE